MRVLEAYKDRRVTASEAVALIKSGDKIFTSGNAATPYPMLEEMANQSANLENVDLYHLLMLGEDPLSRAKKEGHFRHKSLFVGPADRRAVNEGRADYIPIFLYQIPDLFREQVELDVAIIHTSPPDDHGFLSLGVETAASKAAAENAKCVIAMVNERMPRTFGDCFIHISRIDKIVEVDYALPELVTPPFTDVDIKIAEHITTLIGDGATLQLGIGGIPNAVLSLQKGRKNLGIHTEMVSEGIVDVIESGIVNNSKKNLQAGKVIATFALGTQRLYDFLHNNPQFEFHPVDYCNDPFMVAQNDGIVAINSAMEVDLTGQVCSDSIGYRIYSGFGGQVDFIRGAARSKGGKPIIALPSTAKDGAISRITPHLKEGAGVVTSRGDVHYVVTEFGIAYLHGKSLRERVEALIGISHPNFHDELAAFAKDKRWI